MIADADARARFLAEIVTEAWHFQHDAGRRFAETSAELGALFPDHAALIDAWGPRFLETLPGPVAGMVELVERLDRAGVPLFAITNFSAEFWPPFAAREAALFGRFKGIIVSGEERLVKPDPAIYALALARFELAPGEALFVDDRTENVAAATGVGFVGHHFRDAHMLEAELRERSLLLV